MRLLNLERLLLLAVCILFAPLVCKAEVLTIEQFRKLAPKSGKYEVLGYIVNLYNCPPCPDGAQCKPCMGPHIAVSSKNELLKTYPKDGDYLVVFTKNPASFSLGKQYKLTVEVLHDSSTATGLNDLKLLEAVEQKGLALLPYKDHPIIADKFVNLKVGMSTEEVRSIMGKPNKENMVADVWYVDGSMFNQLKVLYVSGKAVRATWIWVASGIHYVHFG